MTTKEETRNYSIVNVIYDELRRQADGGLPYVDKLDDPKNVLLDGSFDLTAIADAILASLPSKDEDKTGQ